MSSLHITLFGKFCVHCGKGKVIELESLKIQELLCYLLLYRDRHHCREKLANMLWPNSTLRQSRRYLRQALWQLQSCLDQENDSDKKMLLVEADWVQVNFLADIWVDVYQFEQAFMQVQGTRGCKLNFEMANALQKAIQFYKGDLLDNWYHDWCLFERERLQNMYLDMLQKLMGYCEAQQEYETGLIYGSQILRCDRAREKAHRRLMRLRYLSGDRTSSLRQYELCSQILKEEFDIEPSKRTTALFNQIQDDMRWEPTPVEIDEDAITKPNSLPDILTGLKKIKYMLIAAQLQVEQDIQDVEIMVNDHHIPGI